mgnify:CR=1 FL=1
MQKDCDFSITGHIGFDPRAPSRKRVIRTPILGGGFPLSLRPILGNPLGLPAFLLMQQPKIRSLKILRPEKDSILSRFWCGRCSKARRLAKMTSQKMPKFCLFRRVRITLFRLSTVQHPPWDTNLPKSGKALHKPYRHPPAENQPAQQRLDSRRPQMPSLRQKN